MERKLEPALSNAVTTSPRRPPGIDPDSKLDRPVGSGSAPRQILDIVIQSCTVELFHALGIAVAPLSASRAAVAPRQHFDLVGVVTFADPKANGTLMVSLNEPIYSLFAPPVAGSHAMHDALRELTNQLIGRIKNRLMQFQLTLRIGLPSAMKQQAMSRQRPAPFATYVFRTLRGEVIVTLDGSIDEETLNYSGRVWVAKEGDFIPF